MKSNVEAVLLAQRLQQADDALGPAGSDIVLDVGKTWAGITGLSLLNTVELAIQFELEWPGQAHELFNRAYERLFAAELVPTTSNWLRMLISEVKRRRAGL